MRPWRPLPLLFLALALIACQSGAGPLPPAGSARRLPGVPLSGRVECAGCRVELFDGAGLQAPPVAADGSVTLAASPGGGVLALFVSGPAQVPQVRIVGVGRGVGLIRLQPSPDARLGYLAVAVLRAAGEGGPEGPRLAPVAGAGVSLSGGDARLTALTDQGGAMVLPLRPGSYSVEIAGGRHTVEVSPGNTAALPIVIGARRTN